MKSILFISAPAAGKGTISEMIEEKYNIPHISVGALLRSARNRGDEIGKHIIQCQDSGVLVDNQLTIKLLEQRITQEDCSNGYVLDGFPRSVEQAELYDELLQKLNKDLGIVILLEVDKEIGKQRITGRLSCPKCNKVYNSNNPNIMPKQENICDECGTKLIKRADDNAEAFEKRYNTYLEETRPLIEYYEDKGTLHKVDANSSEIAFPAVEAIIND